MRPPFQVLLWPGLGAVAVHLAIGWGVLEHWYASVPARHTVLAISLVPAATSVARGLAAPLRQDAAAAPDLAVPHIDREVPRPSTSDLDQSRRERTKPAPAPPIPVASVDVASGPPSDPASALVRRGTDLPSQAEHFYAASELSRLPALPGEPLIDLGDEAAGLDGTVELRLYIDETGRVVASRVERSEGLPAAISDKLTSAFAGYPYIAGQRDGQAVKSDVTLVIGIRDGQPAGTVSR